MACNYHIGRLKPFVYLIKNLVYKMNGYKAYIVSGEVYKVNADLVTFREAESFSGRFKFTTTVNVTFNSMMDDTFIRSNQFHVVVEDGTGLQFLVSPEFVADCTTELTIDDKQTTQTLTFTTQSNIPTRIVGNTITPTSVTQRQCRYNTIGVNKLFIEDNGWQRIDFITCEYSKVFDGTKIVTQIDFTIPIEDNDWHYDLISFPDNRWHMKIESNGEAIEGFNMFPQYTRQTSEQPTGTDSFSIRMRGVEGGTLMSSQIIDPEQTRWVSVDGEYICDGYDKYVKEQKQIYQNGQWVDTTEYRKGLLLERHSEDCGYVPGVKYRWVTLDINQYYTCVGFNKHYQQLQQVSYDEGITWHDTSNFRDGDLYEVNSLDCGYEDITWVVDGYICEEYDPTEEWIITDEYYCEIVEV